METYLATGSIAFLFGIVGAKWALDLGYSQFTQILLFLVGLVAGPVVLFVLYLRMIYAKRKRKDAGGQAFGRMQAVESKS